MTVRINPTNTVPNAAKIMCASITQGTLSTANLLVWRAPAAGKVLSIKAFCGTGCTGTTDAEKCTVQLAKNSVSILSAALVVDKAATTTVVSGVLEPSGGAAILAKGDELKIMNAYTADAPGSTGADLTVSVEWQLD